MAQPSNWRPQQQSGRKWKGARWLTFAGLTVAVILVIALIVNLALAPLYAWRTGIVMLAFDDYEPRMFEPVPFCREDIAAWSSRFASSGQAANILPPRTLEGLDSAEVVRASLASRSQELGMRRKDVLVAYVRGQSLVVPPRFDAEGNEQDDPLGGRPCLLAADCGVRGQSVSGLVPIREVVESLGSATNYTTLVAIDLGSLGWDPRLGIVSPLVPGCLDDEFAPPQTTATFATWVIGSHDTFEVSWASGPDRRTFFSHAMELALAGHADAEPWGDADGLVELDELARFVGAWTNEWVRRASGGRHSQRPVVWKIGLGRVPLAKIPPGIAIVRVPRTTAPEAKPPAPEPAPAPAENPPPKTAFSLPGGALELVRAFPAPFPGLFAALLQSNDGPTPKGEPTPDEPASTDGPGGKPESSTGQEPSPPPATEKKQPSTTDSKGGPKSGGSPKPEGATKKADPKTEADPPQPRRLPTLWELVDLATRRSGEKKSSALPIDYAPHIWNTLVAQAATASVRLDRSLDESDEPAVAQAMRARDELRLGLAQIFAPDSVDSASALPAEASTGVTRLERAIKAATAGGFFERWSAAPARFRTALSIRNDTAERLLATSDLMGRVAQGAGTPRIEPQIFHACSRQVAALSNAIARLAEFEEDVTLSQADSLDSMSRAVATERVALDAVNASLVAGILDYSVAAGVAFDGNVATAALRVPGIGTETRSMLVDILGTEQAPETESGSTFLNPSGPPEPVDALQRTVSRERAENVQAHCDLLLRAIEASGLSETGLEGLPEPLVWPLERMAAVRRAAALVTKAVDDEERLNLMISLGGRLVHLYAEIADAADRVAHEADEVAADDRVTSLFRVVSHRDVMRIADLPDIQLPRWHKPDRLGLRFESAADGFHDTDAPLKVVVVTAASTPPADDAAVRFRYDPADFTLSTTSGETLSADRVYRCGDLPFRSDGLVLRLAANRHASAAAQRLEAELTVVIETRGGRDVASKRFKLPDERSIRLAARRLRSTGAEEGWTYAMPQAPGDSSSTEWRETLLPLPMRSGRPAIWALALENHAEIGRDVRVAVYSIPSGPEPGSRARAWNRFRQQLLDGVEPSAKLLGTIKSLAVPAGGGRAVIVMPPPAPAETLPSPPSSQPAEPEAVPLPAQSVGPDLAVAVREQTKGEPPRFWLHRVGLLVLHPRTAVAATATWLRDTRTISVEIGPCAEGSLAEPVRCRLDPLSAAPVTGQQPLVVRRGEAILSPENPRQSLLADWNGADRDARAWLSIAVDGYPRAFVFGVECSAASAGEPQHPLHDWRGIAIRDPRDAEKDVKAPLAEIPVAIQADAPPDSTLPPFQSNLDAAGDSAPPPPLSLMLSERDGVAGPPRSEAIVWSAAADRQMEFIPGPPRPGATLVIEPRVSDWTIAPSSNGYVDVDVVVEARLNVPGVQAPLTDRRRLRLDGTPPRVEVPPLMNAEVGRPLTVLVRALDDPREAFGSTSGIDLPGVTGVQRVDWAIDLAGNGKPEAWQPAVGLGEGRYELRIDTKMLPPGRQTPVLVKAVDRVGNTAEPSRVWISTRPMAAKNGIRGRVVLNGRGEAGVTVQVDGPGAPAPKTSGADGAFQFDQLDPGSYTVRASGAVRNRLYRADPQPVVVEPPPAETPRITIELKPK